MQNFQGCKIHCKLNLAECKVQSLKTSSGYIGMSQLCQHNAGVTVISGIIVAINNM